MKTTSPSSPPRRPSRRRPAPASPARRWWPVAVLAALVLVAGLILLGRPTEQPAPAQPPPPTVPTSGRVKGNPNAPVTVDEWGDFQCPACRALALGVDRQLQATAVVQGRARVVWHTMAFLGQESVWAAEAANCAQEQGQFWAYHDKLYAEQGAENSGVFSKANLERFAAEIGLQTQPFTACLDSDRTLAQVQAETSAGRQQGVTATPTLFVNGQKLEGLPSFAQLQRLVDAAAPATPTGG